MLYSTGGGNWFITSAGGSGGGISSGGRPGGLPTAPAPTPVGGASGDGKVNLEGIEVRVDPRAEWKQIFEEAWRINRDFFYDPNMHGADWPAMKTKYEQFLPHLTSSADLYRVIRWMLSELAVGHSYITSFGERTFERKTVPGGLLGADFEIAGDRYKFKKIYGGLNWSATMRSPLTAPGVNVKEGEFLLAVNGKELKAADGSVRAVREHRGQAHRDHGRAERGRHEVAHGDGRADRERVQPAQHGLGGRELEEGREGDRRQGGLRPRARHRGRRHGRLQAVLLPAGG